MQFCLTKKVIFLKSSGFQHNTFTSEIEVFDFLDASNCHTLSEPFLFLFFCVIVDVVLVLVD